MTDAISTSEREFILVWQQELNDYVTALDWSPDGRFLAAASAEGKLQVYDGSDGKIARELEGHRQGIDAMSWRPDSRLLTTGGQDGLVKFWDLEGGTIVAVEGGAPWVEHVAWNRPDNPSPTFPRLASAAGRKLKLWDFEGKPVRDYPDHEKTISALQWLPGKQIISTGAFGGIWLWGASDGELKRQYPYGNAVLSAAWSPNRRWVVAGSQDNSVHIWRAKTGEEMHMSGFSAKVRQLAWHPGSQLLATGGGPSVTIWDCTGDGPAGRTPAIFEFHESPLEVLAFQSSGWLLASLDQDGGLAIWRLDQPRPIVNTRLTGNGTQLAWSPDSRFLAAADDQGEVRVFRCQL